MTYHHSDWDYSTAAPSSEKSDSSTDSSAAGIAHRHQLIVDERDWAPVQRALDESGAAYQLQGRSYGLVRLELDDSYDAVRKQEALLAALQKHLDADVWPRMGPNLLVARALLAFDDDDAKSTPKVVPSSVSKAELAPDDVRPHVAGDDSSPGTNVRVGVVDTAFLLHAQLEGACLYQPLQPADLAADRMQGEAAGHATFVAGLIKQVAPGVTVQVENAILSDGVGDLVAVHDAICRLVESGVQLINLSLGCVTPDDTLPFVLDHALGWAEQQGLPTPVFVASAGNNATDKKFWPAADERVWAVGGATEKNGGWELADYSGRGDWVDVAAPSDNLLGPRSRVSFGTASFGVTGQDAFVYWSGTSFATAIITGVLAPLVAELGTAALDPRIARTRTLSDTFSDVKDEGRLLRMYGADRVTIRR